ncbi:hypothetical protein [Streptomyces sp. NPDC053367]|uniref:hypothetical protein n=1 Tax=Streptomyces sp. NPDC053367 TaxID=3365700 RepID=UPI0037D4FFFA
MGAPVNGSVQAFVRRFTPAGDESAAPEPSARRCRAEAAPARAGRTVPRAAQQEREHERGQHERGQPERGQPERGQPERGQRERGQRERGQREGGEGGDAA